MRLHPTGNIDRITPQIVDKPFDPNYASDDRSGVDPNTNAEGLVLLDIKTSHSLLHIKGEIGDRLGMVASRRWQTSYHHISIPNRLNLLGSMLFSQFVKHREKPIQQHD